MNDVYKFPFGQDLKKVEQKDKIPKDAFVLGVYASAVHAKWIGADKQEKVKALAVASEPGIFWNGDNAEDIISKIHIPTELGRLLPPDNPNMNGPSAKVLDELILKPLGLNRKNTWLCDLLPESRVNESQCKAIYKYYTNEIVKKYNLSEATIPHFDKKELNSQTRREEILKELEMSGADTLILLGDLPIKCFLHNHHKQYNKLSQFGEDKASYGRKHKIDINGKVYNVIPLCHPRQAGNLGRYNTKWKILHTYWVDTNLSKLSLR